MAEREDKIKEIVAAAIKRARSGDREGACAMLLEVAERDPSQEEIWLWLAGLSEDLEDAKVYLETVLALNPEHAKAQQGLALVEKRLAEEGPGPAPVKEAQTRTPDAGVSLGLASTEPEPEGSAPEQEAEQDRSTSPAESDLSSETVECPKCGRMVAEDAPFCPACGHIGGRSAVEEVRELEPIPAQPVSVEESVRVNDEISPSFTLSIDQAEAIDACLERMAYESEASCIILADVTGQLISERGKTLGINTQVLSALAAGELSATQEMARMVGEKARFNLLLHEGEERSVYLSPVGQKMLLIIVFDGRTPIGLVRIILKNAVEELGPILERPAAAGGDEVSSALDDEFAQQLEDEFDASMDFLIE